MILVVLYYPRDVGKVQALPIFVNVSVDRQGPTACALAAPPPINGKDIVADTDAEKGMISLDAKRRPLQARVGWQLFDMRLLPALCDCVL